MKYYTPILRKKHTISKCDPALDGSDTSKVNVASTAEGKVRRHSESKIPQNEFR
jgi:hypothetical protein